MGNNTKLFQKMQQMKTMNSRAGSHKMQNVSPEELVKTKSMGDESAISSVNSH